MRKVYSGVSARVTGNARGSRRASRWEADSNTLALMKTRQCSRVACQVEAVSTLTYDYADSLAVVGPLSFVPEPHSYDLCARHARSLSVPNGWLVMRHKPHDSEGLTA